MAEDIIIIIIVIIIGEEEECKSIFGCFIFYFYKVIKSNKNKVFSANIYFIHDEN